MKQSEQEKYLGDMINQNGKQHATIIDRISKGYGILANITAILTDIPLGNKRVEIGLDLRQALWINGTLHNSEVWQDLTEQDKRELNKIDHYILRLIIGAHSKAPIEQLYLETSTLSVTQTIAVRRMVYLQTVLQRTEGELIRKIYETMKAEPLPGDWCNWVQKDFQDIKLIITEDQIRSMSPTDYKLLIKEKIRDSVFIQLKEAQASHEKGHSTFHESLLYPQKYLVTHKLTNKEKSLLFNLRCQSVKGIRQNFSKMYFGDIQCRLCNLAIDSQDHTMKCSVLKKHYTWSEDIKYDFIYGSLEDQVEVVKVISSLLEVRDRLLEEGNQLDDRGTPTGA
jgi:hypothetical protein